MRKYSKISTCISDVFQTSTICSILCRCQFFPRTPWLQKMFSLPTCHQNGDSSRQFEMETERRIMMGYQDRRRRNESEGLVICIDLANGEKMKFGRGENGSLWRDILTRKKNTVRMGRIENLPAAAGIFYEKNKVGLLQTCNTKKKKSFCHFDKRFICKLVFCLKFGAFFLWYFSWLKLILLCFGYNLSFYVDYWFKVTLTGNKKKKMVEILKGMRSRNDS